MNIIYISVWIINRPAEESGIEYWTLDIDTLHIIMVLGANYACSIYMAIINLPTTVYNIYECNTWPIATVIDRNFLNYRSTVPAYNMYVSKTLTLG